MFGDISEFLLRTLAQIIVFVILLRFFLQLVRANFRNPLAQSIVQLTSPVIVPVRRLVPPVGKIDTASLLVAYVVQVIMILLLTLLQGSSVAPMILWIALFLLIETSIQLFLYAIVIGVVLSWVAPGSYHPVAQLIDDLTRPVLAPFRQLGGSFGGLDLSPLFAILALGVLRIVVEHMGSQILS